MDFVSQTAAAVQNTINPPPRRFRVVLGVLGALVVVVGGVIGGIALYNMSYDSKVFPGVKVGMLDLGGLSRNEVVALIETANNRYAKEGVTLSFTDLKGQAQSVVINTVVAGDTSSEILQLDSESTAREALNQGRTGSVLTRFLAPLRLRFNTHTVIVPVEVQENGLEDMVKGVLSPFEDRGANARIVVSRDERATVIPEKDGQSFNYQALRLQLEQALGALSFSPLTIALETTTPTITKQDVEKIVGNVPLVLSAGPLSLNYVNNKTNAREEWVISRANMVSWLTVIKDADALPVLVLDETMLGDFIHETVSPAIDTEAKEAKFAIKDGKVEEFQGSQTGLKVNASETAKQVNLAFSARNYNTPSDIRTVGVVVEIVEPTVKTADINELGITDLIGTGYSSFKDSHTNRIKNIALAVKRLNGTLIKPGEVFSANKSAGPFTAENGFLPEMVIKGREIKPEIGGGMCQVGTTLFRMAMNSGMPITERRNHSLVVSYYADPVNGNPGTDATLYEPHLDFKFTNDTGNYLLLLTSIDYKKQELAFSLWGKPDGRSGSYTHPIVKKWIPAGEEQTLYIDDGTLEPGQTKCQNAFRGANATFTYTRTTPAGETIETPFDSYYRPLPRICMVGVPKGSCAGQTTCAPPAGTVSSTSAGALAPAGQ
jgi:vancomycin resistance protein YoaR